MLPAQVDTQEKNNPEFNKQVLSVSEAAKILKVSPSTLRRLEAEGKISSFRKENGYRFFNKREVTELKFKLDSEHKAPKVIEKPQVIVNEVDVVKTSEITEKPEFSYKSFPEAKPLKARMLKPRQMVGVTVSALVLFFLVGLTANKYLPGILGTNVIQQASSSNVLAAVDRNASWIFSVNFPAVFRDLVTAEGDVDVAGNITATGITTNTLSFVGTGLLNNLLGIDAVTKATLEAGLSLAGDIEGNSLSETTVVALNGETLGDTVTDEGNILMAVGGEWVSTPQTEITQLGVIETGTWQAEPIGAEFGGTGLTSYTTGGMLYATSPSELTVLPIGTNGYLLTSNGTAPAWQPLAAALGTTAWLLDGNTGTNQNTQFIGTTDNQGLTFRTNNLERMRLTASGSLGVGTTDPTQMLDIAGAIRLGVSGVGNVLGTSSLGTAPTGNLFWGNRTIADSANIATYATTGVTAGTGLAGGGTVGALTLNVGAGNGVTVNADDIAIDALTSGTSSTTASNSGLEVTADGVRIIGGCSDSQTLFWDASRQVWECSSDGLSGAGANGRVTYWTGSNTLSGTDDFFWDSGSTNLGIGTTAPSQQLDVAGSIRLGAASLNNVLGTSAGPGVPTGNLFWGTRTLVDTANVASYATTAVTAGNGLSGGGTVGSLSLTIDATTTSITSTTASNSGLEVTADGLRLVGGCANNQVLAWDSTLLTWKCATGGGGGSVGGSGAAGQVSFWTDSSNISGSDSFYWNSSTGRLGLGTTAPTSLLHVNGTATISTASISVLSLGGDEFNDLTGNGLVVSGGALTIDATTTSTTSTTASNSGLEVTADGARLIGGCAANQVLAWDDILLVWKCSSITGVGGIVGSGAAGQAAFWTSSNTLTGSNNFYWDNSNGRLGLGTTSPTATLTINSTDPASVLINPFGTSSGNTGELRFAELSANGTEYTAFKSPDSLDQTIVYTLPNSTAPADYLLTYQAGGLLQWKALAGIGGVGDITSVGSVISGAAFSDVTADNQWLGLGAAAGRIEFDDQSTDEVNFIDTNVGIGTSTPGNLLHVRQAAYTTAATRSTYGLTVSNHVFSGLSLGSDANYAYIQTWDSKPLQLNNQGNNTLFNVGGGNLGVATTNPDALLHIVGGDTYLASNANYTFNNSSAREDLYVFGNLEVDGDFYVNTASVNQLNIAGDTILDFTGSGLAMSSGSLTIDADTTSTTSTTASNSGLELTAAGVRLIGGCSNNQILTWNATLQTWVCSTQTGGGTVNGSGAAGQAAFWSDSSTITGTYDFFWEDSSNRLGIGTTVPSQSLDVQGAIRLGAASNNNVLNTSAAGGSPTGNLFWGDRTVIDTSNIGTYATTSVTAGSGLTGGGSNGALTVNIGAGLGITVNTDDITLDVVTSGVSATTASNSGLELASDGLRMLGGCDDMGLLSWNSTTQVWECAYIGGTNGLIGSGQENQVAFFNSDGKLSGTNDFYWNSSTGRLGLGTTAPTSKLQIAGDITPTATNTYNLGSTSLRWQNIFADSGLSLGASGDSYDIAYNTTSNTLGFNVNGSGNPEFIMTSGGLLGIGTTNPTQELSVVGDITLSGQIQLGNMSSDPTALGGGSMYFNTASNSFKCNNGSLWIDCGGTVYANNNTVTNQDFLTVTHNQGTNDLLASAWIYDTISGQWKQATNKSHSIDFDLDNEFNPSFKHKRKATTVGIDYNENDLGLGTDGAISITTGAANNINATNFISGRSCTDGGDAVNYNVTALTSNTATLEAIPSTGCLAAGDEVLLINLQGGNSDFSNVGNYETLRVASISSSTVTFTTNKTKYYGTGVTSDSGIGLSAGSQIVMLQRVPNYTTVSVTGSGTNFVPADWVSPTGSASTAAAEGGVMFFRATGTVSVGSGASINANNKGYIGPWDDDASVNASDKRAGGNGGESICGIGGTGGYNGTAGTTGAGGGGGSFDNTNYGAGANGFCGGGGASGGTAPGGAGSTNSGGAGGGGGGLRGGGGGGGYGTAAKGGGDTAGAANGEGGDGGTNSSGDGNGRTDPNGGGGGGTYGQSELTQLFFGSSGGEGGEYLHTTYSVSMPGEGGDGGGIVYIAANTLTVSGTLAANGESGGNASTSASSQAGGGGGGAGGSLKIIGNNVTLGSTTTALKGGIGLGYAAGTNTAGYNGGAGGDGRIAVYYSNSYTSSGTGPTPNTYNLSYYPYSIFVSEEIPTPGATSYGNLAWTETLPSGSNIQFQTRSGATNDSTDGTWEEWKPFTSGTGPTTSNYTLLSSADTHTDFTGTGLTVSDGDIIRNVLYFEDEDQFTTSNATKLTNASLTNPTAEVTISSADLSGYDYISAWVYTNQGGNSMKIGIGESAGNEQEESISIDAASTWQKLYWDISDITAPSRDAITKVRFTLVTANQTAYIDDIRAEKSLLTTPAGSAITSTANDYIQYRAILTTTNTANQPYFSDPTITYTNPEGTYAIDASRIIEENDANYYSSGRLQVSETELDSVKGINTEISQTSITAQEAYDPGTGSDGAITITSDSNINSTSFITGRSCTDGGDAVNYSVTALTSTTATLESAPATGCLSVGDEVLLINLQGGNSAFSNVGNYETLKIASISSNTISFTTAKTKYYGANTTDDTSIGLAQGEQAVMLQRVPQYTNVTVSGSGTDFTPDDWVTPTGLVNNGAGEGGVMFFRASGTVTIGSGASINASSKGYIGPWDDDANVNATDRRAGGNGGESICGIGGTGGYNGTAGTTGAGGGGGSFDNTNYGAGANGFCGGGGASGGTAPGGAGSTNSGGAGGGGGGLRGGGGGGGYGTAAKGGGDTSGTPNGEGGDGSINASGNGNGATEPNGGGGGGTYGTSDLSKLYFGSSGGEGGEYLHTTYSVSMPGEGGDGGGIVYIAANTLTVSGTLAANGESGGNASTSASSQAGGGGGGAGGSLKIIGNNVTLGSTTTALKGGIGLGYAAGTNTAGYNGGAGGDGRIAVYYVDSYSSSSTGPTPETALVSTNNYAIFTSDEIATPNAVSYDKLRFNYDKNKYGMVQFQTRSGKTNNATDGSWEAWKPYTSSSTGPTSANFINLEGGNYANWTSPALNIVDGSALSRNVNEFEDEDVTAGAGQLTKLTTTGFTVDMSGTLNTSLISYWDMDESSAGTTATSRADSYGSNTLTDGSTVPSATGLVGNAGDFESTSSDFLEIADNTALSTGDIDFTVSAWVKLESKPASTMSIVSKRDSGTVIEYVLRWDDGSDRFQLVLYDSAGSVGCAATANNLGAPSLSTWYNIVAWHDATADTCNIQVNNGTADTAAETATSVDDTANFRIGAINTAETAFFDGTIDEVGFWKKVLTSQERTDLYNAGAGSTYGVSGQYAESTISSTNLSNYDMISAWVYSSVAGNTVKLGFGESAATENEKTFYIDSANTWQKVYWNITDIDPSLRNTVTKLRATNLSSTGAAVYLDRVQAERLMNSDVGSTIASTPNEFIQYRAILTSTNNSYKPILYNTSFTYETGYKIVQLDDDTVRLYNFSGDSQQLRLNVSGAAFTNLANPWTDAGSYLYPTGFESMRIYDPGGTKYLSLSNDGTNAYFGTDGTNRAMFDAAGNFAPATDVTYDLGSTTNRWDDIYVGPDSLHIYSNAIETGTAKDWSFGIQTQDGANEGNLRFMEGSNEYMTITPAGDVGIGMTAPTARLTVAGTMRVYDPSGAHYLDLGLTGGNAQFSVDGTTNWYLNSTGLGIGVTSPTAKLTVSANTIVALPAPTLSGTNFHLAGADGANNRFLMDSFGASSGNSLDFRAANTSASGPGMLLSNDIIGAITFSGYGTTGYSSDARARILGIAAENWTDSAQGAYLTFRTTSAGAATAGGTERMRIAADGNIAIGTTIASQATLNVAGNMILGSNSFIAGRTAPSMGLLVEGRVGIGVTAATGWPTSPLAVAGLGSSTGISLVVDGSGNFFKASSSLRYKENIEDLDADFSKILDLRPVSYTYKGTGSKSIGYIAEEAEALSDFEGLLVYNDQGQVEGIRYDLMTVYLKEIIKGHDVSIESLENRVDELEQSQGSDIDNRVTFLEEILGVSESSESSESSSSSDLLSNLQDLLAQAANNFTEMLASIGLTSDEETLTVSKDLNVLGSTTLNDLTVTGDLFAGQISIDSIENSIDINAPSCYNEGTQTMNESLCEAQALYLQKGLAGNVDIFNGKVTILPDGSIHADEVVAGSYSVRSDSETVGSTTLTAGQTEIVINTTKVNQDSKVFVTPQANLTKPLYIKERLDNVSFTIAIDEAQTQDIRIDWWILSTE